MSVDWFRDPFTDRWLNGINCITMHEWPIEISEWFHFNRIFIIVLSIAIDYLLLHSLWAFVHSFVRRLDSICSTIRWTSRTFACFKWCERERERQWCKRREWKQWNGSRHTFIDQKKMQSAAYRWSEVKWSEVKWVKRVCMYFACSFVSACVLVMQCVRTRRCIVRRTMVTVSETN